MKSPALYLYFFILLLVGCTRSNPGDKIMADSLRFPLRSPLKVTSTSTRLASTPLDSVDRINWADKIMPAGLAENNLYEAFYLARYNKVGEFNVITIDTRAADWRKSFLLTLNQNAELVDYMMMTNDVGDATQDEKRNQTVTGRYTWTDFIENGTFRRTSINTTVSFYLQPNQIEKKDSVVEVFKIDDDGKFKIEKRDSVRIVK